MTSKFLESRPLFKECIEALGATLLPTQESDKLSQLFENSYPITYWGKIDWDRIEKKIYLEYDPERIISSLEELLGKPIDKTVYVDWSDGRLPAIQANLDLIIKYFDIVRRVTFEKFIFNLSEGYIVEIKPGDITVGVISKEEVYIKISPQKFNSKHDRESMSEWLAKAQYIKSVQKLDMYTIYKNLSRNDLADLIALFKRYRCANIEQLEIFKSETNKDLFEHNEQI
ncbi:MAG: hypothetical protein WC707_04720 [Candidatus Babeliaceae bacterium]|jgi:hypothetical protein